MSKNIMQLSIAVFFLILSAGIIIGGAFMKDYLDRQVALSELQLQRQAEIIESANQTKDVITDLAFAFVARSLEQKGLLSPTDADKVANYSLEKVSEKSERLGIIINSMNDAFQKKR